MPVCGGACVYVYVCIYVHGWDWGWDWGWGCEQVRVFLASLLPFQDNVDTLKCFKLTEVTKLTKVVTL